MRITGSAAYLSWIPPTAVEGTFGLPFDLGIAHYDQPPPDAAPDIDALLAADAIRFANQLRAWIETGNGRIVNHGMSGCGRLGSTTVRLGSHGLTFAGVALPDLTTPPEMETGPGPLHPDRWRPHWHRGAPAGVPPAVLAATADRRHAAGAWHSAAS